MFQSSYPQTKQKLHFLAANKHILSISLLVTFQRKFAANLLDMHTFSLLIFLQLDSKISPMLLNVVAFFPISFIVVFAIFCNLFSRLELKALFWPVVMVFNDVVIQLLLFMVVTIWSKFSLLAAK